MIVKVNLDTMQQENNNINNHLSDYDNCLQKIKTIVSNMSNVWPDNTYVFFESKMQDFILELSKIKEQLESYNDYVNGYIKSVDSLEREYSNKKITIE